ncbi:DUF4153 domain-containing protein [Scandinavium goeteborgense]|uniref:DUF4153 domain-containing protein n=1 Tax=Scandinavium goeteborgense TaxID=1851514 RepID=UPI000F674C9C|nr:DUF4153 domain-containing protein [Scandinavium goeteborgense]QKN80159.1 DUF4153 domain-containing protein [Scandinavium goeteborgense]
MKKENGYSTASRAVVLLVGMVLGILCYLLARHNQLTADTDNNFWSLAVIVMAVPATVMATTTFTSSRKPMLLRVTTLVVLWGFLALFGIAAGHQDALSSLERWDRQEWFLTLGAQLMLIGLLILPWLQWRFELSEEQTFYTAFYRRNGFNALTLLVVMIANGLFWLILLLWAKLFEMVDIRLFTKIFFDSGWFFSVVTGAISSLVVMLTQQQAKRMAAIQNLLTLLASWLLPLVSLLTLSFIVVLPFVGLETLSHQLSAAGLLNCLALISLFLVAVVFGPERNVQRYPKGLRYLIYVSILVLPLYAFLASWALWLRVHQYGWTPERLYAVLVTCTTVIWTMGYCVSLLFNRRDPLRLQDKVVPGVFLLMLILLILLRTPLLDVWKISVNDQMARYQSGAITAEQVSLYMFSQAGNRGHQALQTLQQDEKFMAVPQRRQELTMLMTPRGKIDSSVMQTQLKNNVDVVPADAHPDEQLWVAIGKEQYESSACLRSKDDCLLVSQDLNRDGQPEWVLYQFTAGTATIYKNTAQVWALAGQSRQFPKALTKSELLKALAQNKVLTVKKEWDDLSIFGERMKIDYYDAAER